MMIWGGKSTIFLCSGCSIGSQNITLVFIQMHSTNIQNNFKASHLYYGKLFVYYRNPQSYSTSCTNPPPPSPPPPSPHHLHPQHQVCEHKYVHNAGGLTGRQICWHVGRPLGKKALKSTEPMLCMLRYTIQSLPCHVKPIDGHCAYDATTVYGSIVF